MLAQLARMSDTFLRRETWPGNALNDQPIRVYHTLSVHKKAFSHFLSLSRSLSHTCTHTLLHAADFKKWSRLNEAEEARWDELNEGEERSFPLHQILICCDCIRGQVRPRPDGWEHARAHARIPEPPLMSSISLCVILCH